MALLYFLTKVNFIVILLLPNFICTTLSVDVDIYSKVTRNNYHTRGSTIDEIRQGGNTKSIQHSGRFHSNSKGMAFRLRKCCRSGQVVHIDFENPKTVRCTTPEINGTFMPNSKLFSKEIQRDRVNIAMPLLKKNRSFFCKENGSELIIRSPSMQAPTLQRAQIRVNNSEVYTRASGNHNWVRGTRENNLENVTQLCVDNLNQKGLKTQHRTEASGAQEFQILVFCQSYGNINRRNYFDQLVATAHATIMIIASVLLSLTVLSHVLVRDTDNTQGWTVTSYCFSMLVCQIFLASHNIIRIQNGGSQSATVTMISHTTCVAIGIIFHYFFIAMYSWMAVINFDMWSIIVSMTKPTMGRSKNKLHFIGYACFGFGTPAVLVLMSVFIEFYFGYFDDFVIRPLYGAFDCDLDDTSFLYYEIIPIVILVFAGVTLCSITVKFLLEYRITTKKLHEVSPLTNERLHEQRVYFMTQLIWKMVILLAVSFVFPIGGMLWYLYSTSRYYFIFFDIHNVIQSIGFFWIFTCKREVLEKLRNKYAVFKFVFSRVGRAERSDGQK